MHTRRLSLSLRLTGVLGGALTLAIAGCGSSSKGSTAPSSSPATTAAASASASASAAPTTAAPTPTVTPTPTPTPTVTPSVVPASYCRITELQLSAGESSAGAGNVGVPILFRNSGSRSCVLLGYPGVAGLTSAGQQAVQAVRTPLPNGGTPTSVTLPQGQYASALVQGSDVPSGSATSCPQYTLLVTPPNETHSQRVPVYIPGCNLRVSPVVLGKTGGV